MKCPICDGKGYVYNALGSFYEDCGHCQGTGKVRAIGEPMTNEEWLRTLPADERVKEILNRDFMTEKRTAEEFVEWLKEKHNENT